jgi:ubiquinone/menaquinone biosynthesis C-methylase UbiE
MSGQEQWQLDGSAPELYERYLVPATTAVWAPDLIERAGLQAGERVLDVACGTGIVARLAAAQVGSTGRVAGLDLNAGMLEMARSLQDRTGSSIAWHHGSVLAMPFPDAAFDAVLCQLGLQFFPDRPTALQETHRVLAPGGRLALNVYSAIERNPAPRALADALDRHLDPSASAFKRAEHVLADAETVRTLVGGAGFRDPEVHAVTKTIRFPSPREWVRIQLAATPLATVVGQMESGQRTALLEALVKDVGRALEPYVDERGLAFPQEGHVVLARG